MLPLCDWWPPADADAAAAAAGAVAASAAADDGGDWATDDEDGDGADEDSDDVDEADDEDEDEDGEAAVTTVIRPVVVVVPPADDGDDDIAAEGGMAAGWWPVEVAALMGLPGDCWRATNSATIMRWRRTSARARNGSGVSVWHVIEYSLGQDIIRSAMDDRLVSSECVVMLAGPTNSDVLVGPRIKRSREFVTATVDIVD